MPQVEILKGFIIFIILRSALEYDDDERDIDVLNGFIFKRLDNV